MEALKNLRRSNRLITNGSYSDENKSFLHNLPDGESDYYEQIVHPLLVSNNERNLINWLKSTKLIKSQQKCSQKMDNVMCNSPMAWVGVRGQELFQWKCDGCSRKMSIRDDSIFSDLACNFKDAIRIIHAWCQGLHFDHLLNMLDVNRSVIEELYIRAASIAERSMKSNISDWQVGGPGVIVIIDTYPEGCSNMSMARMTRPILCISEIKSIPQKYYLEALGLCSRYNTGLVSSLRQRIIRTVQAIVRPGSILVIPTVSTLCTLNDFQHLKTLYPTIVTVKDLARHNDDKQNVFYNLETIWKRVLDVCEEAQFYCTSYVDLFVVSHMWRKVYGNEAFEMLLYQMSLTQ